MKSKLMLILSCLLVISIILYFTIRFKNLEGKTKINKDNKVNSKTLKESNYRNNSLRFEKEISYKYQVEAKLDTLSKIYSQEYESLIGNNLIINDYLILDVYKDINGIEKIDVLVRYDEMIPIYVKLSNTNRTQLNSSQHGYIVFKLGLIKKNFHPLNLENEYGEVDNKLNFTAEGELITIIYNND